MLSRALAVLLVVTLLGTPVASAQPGPSGQILGPGPVLPPGGASVRICQSTIRARLVRQLGLGADVRFVSATRYVISSAQEGVRGTGQVRVRGGSARGFSYDCVVNIRVGRVARADYRLAGTEPGLSGLLGVLIALGILANLDQWRGMPKAICQEAIQDEIEQHYGPRVQVSFDDARTAPVGGATRVTGWGSLRFRRHWEQFTYTCLVRGRQAIQADYVIDTSDRPVSSEYRCEQAIRDRIVDDYDGRVLVSFETAQTSFISNAEEGVQGTAVLWVGGRWRPIQFGCVVNIRSGRVTQAAYRLR